MNTLTDPAFIRYKYTSYLLLAGAFLLVMLLIYISCPANRIFTACSISG